MIKYFLITLAFLSSLSSWALISTAELRTELEGLSSTQKSEYYKTADQLRCPTCTGLSVLQSDAPFSLQIRNALIEQIKEGKQKSEIIPFFTGRFGLWILREPPKEGFHLLAWFIPILLAILAVVCVTTLLLHRTNSRAKDRRDNAAILKEMQLEIQKLRAEKSS